MIDLTFNSNSALSASFGSFAVTSTACTSIMVAFVAVGIVGARNNVLTAEPLKASGEAARRMGRRTLKYRLRENHGFFNNPHTSVREKRIGREKYTRQSNVK